MVKFWILFALFVWSGSWLHNLFSMGPQHLFKIHGMRRPEKWSVRVNWLVPPFLAIALLIASACEAKWKAVPHHLDRWFGNLAVYWENRGLYSTRAQRVIIWVLMIFLISFASLLTADF